MKIEKISDNQIRCTLTKEDLSSRHIRLSELAYGSPKAKELFNDMMVQAQRDCGFEANGTPLMIEAIPLSAESIVLIITKVDDPDELDTRFSRFSSEDGTGSRDILPTLSGADDIIDLISRLTKQARAEAAEEPAAPAEDIPVQEISSLSQLQDTPSVQKTSPTSPAKSASAGNAADSSAEKKAESVDNITRFYLFNDLGKVIQAAKALTDAALTLSSLFQNPEDGNYFLLVKKDAQEPLQFNKTCNTLSEYGLQIDYLPGMEQYFTEHLRVIIHDGKALSKLQAL